VPPVEQKDAVQTFEESLALSILTATRWAVQRGPGTDEEKRAFWSATLPPWAALLGKDMWQTPGMAFSMAMMTAGLSLLPADRIGDSPDRSHLAKEAERRVLQSGSDADIERHPAEVRPSVERMQRHARRWLARVYTRLMEVMLTRETHDGVAQVHPATAAFDVIDRALAAMGVEPADREPKAPPSGVLEIPPTLIWWRPSPVSLGAYLSLGVGSTSPDYTDAAPPEAHRRNTELILEPDHFPAAVGWYATEVLPFIDDYGGTREWGGGAIGRSAFSASLPYNRQHESVRLFLWALADAMLVRQQMDEAAGRGRGEIYLRRLPLIRAIYEAELEEATHAALGLGPTDLPPDLTDPSYVKYALRRADGRAIVEREMRRFLSVAADAGPSWVDTTTALQIAMAARAGRRADLTKAARSGCGSGTAILLLLGGALLARLRRAHH